MYKIFMYPKCVKFSNITVSKSKYDKIIEI